MLFGSVRQQSTAPKQTDVSVFVNFPKEALGNVPEHAALVGQSIRTAASLTDMPTNELYTDAYVEVARATAERIGCEIRVRVLTMRALLHPAYVRMFVCLTPALLRHMRRSSAERSSGSSDLAESTVCGSGSRHTPVVGKSLQLLTMLVRVFRCRCCC